MNKELEMLISLVVRKIASQGGEATQELIDNIAIAEVEKLQSVAQFFPFGNRVISRIAELLLAATQNKGSQS